MVAVWNAKNPNIQVKVQTGPNGNGGTYQNFFNQLKAGNAPDLGQIEYDALPGFRVQDGLFNLGACDIVAKAKDQFVPWTWNQVSFGDQAAAYGVPQDAGPMALFYRADLFEQHGIAVPKTWDGVRRRGREGPGGRRLHHQLLAERHQPVRRAGLAGRRPLVRQRRPDSGPST